MQQAASPFQSLMMFRPGAATWLGSACWLLAARRSTVEERSIAKNRHRCFPIPGGKLASRGPRVRYGQRRDAASAETPARNSGISVARAQTTATPSACNWEISDVSAVLLSEAELTLLSVPTDRLTTRMLKVC